MNTVAVFRWTDKLPSDEEVEADPATQFSADFGEQWAYLACLPVATAVLHVVRDLGHKTDVETPYFGEHDWNFGVEIENKWYSIIVTWIPRGDRNDYFAAMPSLRRGCFASVFFPRVPESCLRPACALLQEALAAHPLVADLEWVGQI
jgi:hypothetical protein